MFRKALSFGGMWLRADGAFSPSWFRSLAARGVSWVPTFLTLSALSALALWGWYNDWSLSLSRPGDQRTKTETTQTVAKADVKVHAVSHESATGSHPSSSSRPWRIEFPSADVVRKVGIQVTPAQERDMTRSVSSPGMVDYDPARYAHLTARTSGTVWRVYKEIGDPIDKGEVLALIESAEVGKCKADFLLSLAQFELRDETLKRKQAAASSLSEEALRTANAAQREARIRLFNDRQALVNLGFSVHLADLADLSDIDRVRFMRLLGLPDELRKAPDAETLTANLLPLTAPFDGQVVERNAGMGEVVQTTQRQVLFIVADVHMLHVDLDVNPEDMAEVKVGQPVTFRSNDGGSEATGKVSHISPEVDAKTRRVRVHAEMPNPSGRLRPNTFGTGRILVGEHPHAVVVPSEAVQTDGVTTLVFVRVSQKVFEARPVQPGLRQGNVVEVSGVQPGEDVVTTGSFVLRSDLQKSRIASGNE